MKMSKLFTMALISAMITFSTCTFHQIHEITGITASFTDMESSADGTVLGVCTQSAKVYCYSIGSQLT